MSTKGLSSASRARGPYTTQACAICRAKKSKCDGVKPICSPCKVSGKNAECVWGRETAARKPRTDANFESLQKRADDLQTHVDQLEAILAKCACQDSSSHLQFRPLDPEVKAGEETETDWDESDSEDITRELTIPMQRLALDTNFGGGLLLNGMTAPFRTVASPSEAPVLPSRPMARNQDQSYVLLLDGVDEVDHVDWSRNLPVEVALERKEHDRILDLAFKFYTGWGLRIVPSLFLKDMHRALSVPVSQPPPKTPCYSPMLHNALLGVCTVFANSPYIRDRKTRQYFVDAAKRRLEIECQKPEISLVHALAFLTEFYMDGGDRILADLYIAMSSRICISLGLGVDCTPWVEAGRITSDEMQGRIWTWWQVQHMDVSAALYIGRDVGLPPVDGRAVQKPSVDVVADQTLWIYAGNPRPQPNMLTLTFQETAMLSLIGRKVVELVNGMDPTADIKSAKLEETVAKINTELKNWKTHLPRTLEITKANRAVSSPYRLMLHCEYWSYLIFLHRPFFKHRDPKHFELCKLAAEKILDLTETWSTFYSLRYSPPTLAPVIFAAGTIFLLIPLRVTASARPAVLDMQTALQQCEQCIRHLLEMGWSWGVAARTGDILRFMLHEKIEPVLARRLERSGVQSKEASAAMPSGSSSGSKPTMPRSFPSAADKFLPGLAITPATDWSPASSRGLNPEWFQESASSSLPPQNMEHMFGDPSSFASTNATPEFTEAFLADFDWSSAELWPQESLGTEGDRSTDLFSSPGL